VPRQIVREFVYVFAAVCAQLGRFTALILPQAGTDIYWARSRVLEYMQGLARKLPEGVTPTLGPDATGVGWVFQYALVDESGRRSLAELRMKSFADLREAVMRGAIKRIRPKMMTVIASWWALPILWGHGTGADVMKRIAAPMIGGVITSDFDNKPTLHKACCQCAVSQGDHCFKSLPR
jgi:Cu/Ag efflux pump CusA